MAGYNHWSQVAQGLKTALAQTVTQTARNGEQHIQEWIRTNGQVDTGFLLSSVYHVTHDESTYDQAGTPPGDSYLLPEVDKPADEFTAFLGVAANYGIYQNNGTRYLPPRPFFEPGIEETQHDFEADLAQIEPKIKGSITIR